MARKKSSKKRPPATPKSQFRFTPTYSRSRQRQRELSASLIAADSGGGLLQLKFGRASHMYGLIAAFALVANAFFIYWVNQFGTFPALPLALDTILWLLPLVVGGVVAAHAIDIKWSSFRGRHGARHFLLSVAGFTLAMLGLVLILFSQTGFLTFDADFKRFMYPFSTTAISLTLISMASTWSGHSVRKMLSILSAIGMPLILAAAALAGMVPTTSGQELLAMLLYFVGALTAEISGSMLHIIASSTSAVQREILRASDEKLEHLQVRLRESEKALQYKQKGLYDKEAIIESERAELEEEAAKVAEQRKEAVRLQAQADADTKHVRELEREVAGARAQIEAQVEEIKRKDASLVKNREDLEKARKALSSREAAISERDKMIKRAEIQLESQQRHVESRLATAKEIESRLVEQDKAIEAKRKELHKVEKDLQLRASEVQMQLERAESVRTAEEKARAKDLKAWEDRLLQKERELGQNEVELRSLETELKRRYEDATRIEAGAKGERERLRMKEGELVAREQKVSDLEESVRSAEAQLDGRAAAIQEAEARIEEMEGQYNEMFRDAKLRQATATTDADETSKRKAALDVRQKKLDERDETVRAEIKRLNEENRNLRRLQKELEDRESTLSLRELEAEKTEQEARAVAAIPTKDVDREGYMDQWEKRLREREEKFKREKYQREKELEMREAALKASIQADVTEAAETVVVDEQKAAKVRTGTLRLDDLMFGGLPFNSSVLWVGPAFAGKEVGILNFLAEGLRKGIPAVIVTTTKPPVDVAKDMAPILPTFVEFEQLGLVRWVDCSSTGDQSTGKYVREQNVFKVAGPQDFEAITDAVNDIDDELREKHPYFRLAFLTLSSSLSSGDDREGVSFVQRLVNRLRRTKAVNAFALERGMHTDQQLETLEHLMDGAIHFKSEKGKTTLAVVGVGEVQTRDRVPYKFTNNALMIGSFQLERIR